MNNEVKPTWNYILNDLALYSLFMRVAYSEDVSKQDKVDLEHQIKLLQQGNKQLQQKVNQLETNIDTAIDYINKLEFEEYGVLYDNGTSIMEYEDNCKETLLEILKGGSNDNNI